MKISLIVFFLLAHMSSMVCGQAQETANTDVVWKSDQIGHKMVVTSCGNVFFIVWSSDFQTSELFRIDPETLAMKKVEHPLLKDSLGFTSIAQNPVNGEIVLGYWGGIFLSYDCGETWERPPVEPPRSNYSDIEFDEVGRMYCTSGSGDDPHPYWTENYVDWHRMCYDAFTRGFFDVSPQGTVISLKTTNPRVYRVSNRDSCYVVIEPHSLPEDPDAEFRAVHAVDNNNWLLADIWYYVFASEDDGFTWEARYVPTSGLYQIERASESFVMGIGTYYETDGPAIFLSRDMFKTMHIASLNVEGTPLEISLDSIGHAFVLFEMYRDKGYELHRTKESLWPIVDAPAHYQNDVRTTQCVTVQNKQVVLPDYTNQVHVSVYSISGREVVRNRQLEPGGTIDLLRFTGTFMVVVQSKEGEVLCSQTVQIL